MVRIHVVRHAAQIAIPIVETQPGIAATPHRTSSWQTASRAGAWAAGREFAAQGTAVALGIFLRDRLESAQPRTMIACGVAAALLMALMVRRSTELTAAAACQPTPLRSRTVRMAASLPPLAAVATACAVATQGGAMLKTGAYLVSKLVQRCVRDVSSQNLVGVLPSFQVVDRRGEPVTATESGNADWARALLTLVPTALAFTAQEFLAPAPSGKADAGAYERGLPHVIAVGCVEAVRAMSSALATAAIAHSQDRALMPQAAGGWSRLQANLLSPSTVCQAADAAAMRQHFGIVPDMVSVLASASSRQEHPPLLRALRAELKALGDFRAPLVARGQQALARAQEALSYPVPPAPLPSVAPSDPGHPRFRAAPESPRAAPHA